MRQGLKNVQKLIKEKQLLEAVSAYHQLIKVEPQYADINNFYKTFYFAASDSYYVYERGDVNKDLRAYVNFLKQLLSEEEANVKLIVHLADSCYGFYTKNEFLNAIKYCDTAILLDPECKEAYNIKADSLQWLYSQKYGDRISYAYPCSVEELAKIKENWKAVLKLESDATKKEAVQRYIEECEEKIAKCEIAQKQSKYIHDAEIQSITNISEAMRAMDKAIALDTTPNINLLIKKGYILLKEKHFDEAKKVFESSISYFDNEMQAAAAFEGLGVVHFTLYKINENSADLTKAVEHLRTAYDSFAYDQRVNLLLAETYSISGDLKQALVILKKALQKNCGAHRTINTMEELKTFLMDNSSFESFIKDNEARAWMGLGN